MGRQNPAASFQDPNQSTKTKQKKKNKKSKKKKERKESDDSQKLGGNEGNELELSLAPLTLSTATPFRMLDIPSKRERVRRLSSLDEGPLKSLLQILQSEIDWEQQSDKRRFRWTNNQRRKSKLQYIVPALDWQVSTLVSIDLSGINLAVPPPPVMKETKTEHPSQSQQKWWWRKSNQDSEAINKIESGDATPIYLLSAYLKRRPRIRKVQTQLFLPVNHF